MSTPFNHASIIKELPSGLEAYRFDATYQRSLLVRISAIHHDVVDALWRVFHQHVTSHCQHKRKSHFILSIKDVRLTPYAREKSKLHAGLCHQVQGSVGLVFAPNRPFTLIMKQFIYQDIQPLVPSLVFQEYEDEFNALTQLAV